MKPAIKVKALTVHYPHQKTTSLNNISFELKPGTITALIGPNGSGKTTLIKAILGIVPYNGSISFFGQGQKAIAGRIGYVPQRFNFDTSFPISVKEFLFLALITCKDSSNKKHDRITQALELVGLQGTEEKSLHSLSGGQIQRLLLSRAIIHEPNILILDEPEAGIDVEGEQVIYTILESLAQSGLTIMIASHELDIVSSYADMVICVNRELVCQGSPQTVLTQKTFQQMYGHDLKLYGHNHH